jgi:hypothetical protein
LELDEVIQDFFHVMVARLSWERSDFGRQCQNNFLGPPESAPRFR